MKLKEAQMLGILALIAVGIILLCMWGGGDDLTKAAGNDGSAGGLAAVSVDDGDLFRELMGGSPASPSKPGGDQAVVMEVGTGQLPSAPASEEAVLQDVIEQRDPADIGLMQPPKPEPKAAPQPGRTPRVVVVHSVLPPPPIVHVVKAGETLSELSTKYYGTAGKVKVITDANPGVDPRRMPIGTRLKIPRIEGLRETAVVAASGPPPALSAVSARAPSGAPRRYTVQKGDSLYRIALKFYNDGKRFHDIRMANRDVLPDPDHLRVGMELTIP